jgi:hypothetical protein
MRHCGSLGPAFAPASTSEIDSVRLPFALILTGRFLTHLRQPLDAPVILLGACRPSTTAHQYLSSQRELATQLIQVGVSSLAPQPPKGLVRRLPTTLRSTSREAGTSCSKAPRGLLFPLGDPRLFARLWVRPAARWDSGQRVDPFMHVGMYRHTHSSSVLGLSAGVHVALTRQGIWLPFSQAYSISEPVNLLREL